MVTPTSPENLTSAASLRVLFVDDQPDLRALMEVMLARRSYAVATAGEARDALQIAPDFKPHIVVSDIGMPGMNGFELMKEMREDERLSPFKAVALTGFDADSDHALARAAGFDDCLVKPIDMDYLFSTIERLAMCLSEESI